HIPRGEDQCGLLAVQLSDFALQLDEGVIGPGNVAGAAGTGAHTGCGFDHGADHLRVLAHAEVIVRAPDHDRARAVWGMPSRMGKAPGDALEIGKHAVAPFLVQAGKRGRKEMIIGHGAKSPSWLMLDDWEPVTLVGLRGLHALRSAPSSHRRF